MAKIQDSSFVSGPKDSLATVDVYNPDIKTTSLNKETVTGEILTDLLASVKQPLTGTTNNIEQMVNGDSYKQGATKKKLEEFLASSGSLTGGSIGEIDKHIPLDAMGPGLNTLDFLQDFNGNRICATALDLGLLLLLKKLLKDLLGRDFNLSKIIDLSALALLGAALLALLILYCLREAAKEVYDSLDDNVKRFVGLALIPITLNPKSVPSIKEEDIVNFNEKVIYSPEYITSNKFKTLTSEPVVETASTNSWGYDPTNSYWRVFKEDDFSRFSNPNYNTNKYGGVKDNSPMAPILDNSRPSISSDLEMLNFFIDNLGAEAIMAQYPDTIRNLLQNYRMPLNGVENLNTEYTRLIDTINRLDPKWATSLRGEEEISNLFNFSKASKDSVYLLTSYTDSVYIPEGLISKSYLKNDIPKLLRAQYPKAGI